MGRRLRKAPFLWKLRSRHSKGFCVSLLWLMF